MSFLSADEIFSADDLVTEDVEVPEWGGTLRIKMLTGAERDEFESSMVVIKDGKQTPNFANMRARLVGMCAVDEHGAKLFGTKSDIARLGQKSAAALERAFNACAKLNGISEQDVKELEADFTDDQSESSTTD